MGVVGTHKDRMCKVMDHRYTWYGITESITMLASLPAPLQKMSPGLSVHSITELHTSIYMHVFREKSCRHVVLGREPSILSCQANTLP